MAKFSNFDFKLPAAPEPENHITQQVRCCILRTVPEIRLIYSRCYTYPTMPANRFPVRTEKISGGRSESTSAKPEDSERWGEVGLRSPNSFFALTSLFEGYPRASFWFMVILLKWLLKRLLHKGLPVTPTCTWLCCVIRRFHFLHFIITASRLKSKKKFNIYSDLTKKTSFLTINQVCHLPSNISTLF